MSRAWKAIAAALILLLSPAFALACLWDYDTLAMERQRFPNTLELITGKFLRHSPEFYQWRIKDRLARLEQEPENLALYDDLAVAYDKTGQHELAIETILKKDKLSPGLYETEANLGTLLIHSGQLAEGLEHVKKAIEINPDAHFGREKYQQLLVEYVLSRQVDGKTELPLGRLGGERNFAYFLRNKIPGAAIDEQWQKVERPAALKGLLGIMKFGSHDSPVVLEALGNVLSYDVEVDDDDGKQLAARAYVKAAMGQKDADVKAAYLALAKEAVSMHQHKPLGSIEGELQAELIDASAWYEELHQRELSWIAEGKNADEEFDKLYAEEPQVSPPVDYNAPEVEQRSYGVDLTPEELGQESPRKFSVSYYNLGLFVSLVGLLAAVMLLSRQRRGGKKPPLSSPYVKP